MYLIFCTQILFEYRTYTKIMKKIDTCCFLERCLQWAIFISVILPLMQATSFGNETDLQALLKFKAGITSDPNRIFNSWNDSIHFCQWYGITCSPRREKRVISIELQGQNLAGSISPFIGNLSFLSNFNIRNNTFNGQILQEIGSLSLLSQLFLNNNTFEGEIPANLSRCLQLRILDLTFNKLAGKIPAELGSLPKLEKFQISANNLIGEFPPSLGNLSSLSVFTATRNYLKGRIPDEFGLLSSLTRFSVGQNRLTGKFPASLFNISSIQLLATAENQVVGTLPNNIGFTLPNLRQFAIGYNLFSGSIPSSLCNSTRLQILDFVGNQFVGQVPNCLGNLQNLWWLNVGVNNLGTNSTNDLDFITPLHNCSNLKNLVFNSNNFGGVLPNTVANLSLQLSQLLFGINQITGVIPEALDRFSNLIALDMGHNLFHGIIPSSLGNLQNLRILVLEDNRLSGQIPSSAGNFTNLFQVSLAQNKLEGTIPESIGNCQNLQYLDFSDNKLNGSIPNELFGLSSLSMLLNLSHNFLSGNLSSEIGKLTGINKLDISGNNLSGEITETIGDCLSLEYLYMQENSFQGTIPSIFDSLKGLQELDLSQNQLSGEIPIGLQSLASLSYLNLSFNNLVGEIPTKGVFRNVSALSLIGNKLCGGVPELHQPKCPTKHKSSAGLMVAIIIPCVVFCVVILTVFVLVLRRRREPNKSLSAKPEEIDGFVSISYRELYEITNGFSASNLVGLGGFGSVYEGYLNQTKRLVAIKVLKLEIKGASKSFLAECKVLREVRHRNLVKLISYCSSIDHKGNEFKALVYEFMPEGSLEKWLHHDINNSNDFTSLNFLQRLNIAIDVASALHYLHNLCENPILHCDLKPSNVLLDDEMVAHLGDFGLAKLYSSTTDVSQTVSTGLRGTIGYAPPEYGMGAMASKEGDVYSYGILLLELFTGKKPTDKSFEGLYNLRQFVENALPEGLEQIIDPYLLPRGKTGTPLTIGENEDEDCLLSGKKQASTSNHGKQDKLNGNEKECLVSVFRIGVACSAESPQARTDMRDVAKELHLIKSNYLGVRIYG